MLFNSFSFLVFFIVVTALYYILPFKIRWLLLLIASCIFYAYFIPIYILILFATIIIDYIAGIKIENAKPKNKKACLVISLMANIGILFYFKYFNFFIGNINDLSVALGWNYSINILSIILPIGLSFHTFQAMSYTIEVYRGNQKAEKHFGIYALYVMYYPQLVAGPIERPQNILHQFHFKHQFDYKKISSGLKLMLWGFFKKLVIADNIAEIINPVFDAPNNYQGISHVIAMILFSFQILCDFSGYSDIAIGASRVMGIELMQNFRSPYFSKNISEFWTRWHISLSTWFKDYVYIPMGGNRVSKKRLYFNLFFIFLLSGLWHGASWNFVIWGMLHGAYLIIGIFMIKKITHVKSKIGIGTWQKVFTLAQIVSTFFLVSIAWVFFRVTNLNDAIYFLSKAFTAIPDYFSRFNNPGFMKIKPWLLESDRRIIIMYFIIFSSIIIMEFVNYIELKKNFDSYLTEKGKVRKWSFYLIITWFVLFFGAFHSNNEFIYFQF